MRPRMGDLVSRPFNPDPAMACEACIFGSGVHSEWCPQAWKDCACCGADMGDIVMGCDCLCHENAKNDCLVCGRIGCHAEWCWKCHNCGKRFDKRACPAWPGAHQCGPELVRHPPSEFCPIGNDHPVSECRDANAGRTSGDVEYTLTEAQIDKWVGQWVEP